MRGHHRTLAGFAKHMDVASEVADALAVGRPVVALETALVTNGMPAPTNLAVARSCEALIRAGGAVPATIALLDGRIKVGLSVAQLERLADPAACGLVKVSRRDIAPCIALGRSGGA